jgi:hypothetical protein
MNRTRIIAALVLISGVLFLNIESASAHTTVHAGNYDVEVGWVDEPPIVGQRNAVVVNVSNTTSPDAQVDVSKFTVNVTYGGQTKTLTLQPLSEDSKNQYIAPILPMVAGQYTVQLRGQLDSTSVSLDVQPEEVVPSDTLAFPSVAASTSPTAAPDWGTWLGGAGLIAGLAGLVIALLAWRKKA